MLQAKGAHDETLPWWLRDFLLLSGFVAVLVGLSSGLEAIPISGIAYYNRILVIMGINITLAVSLTSSTATPGSSRSGMPDSWPSARTFRPI